MKPSELAALIRGLTPVIREYVASSQDAAQRHVTGLQDQIKALELRVATLSVTPPPALPDVPPADIAASVAGLLRKELQDLQVPAPAVIRRRVEKDDQGYTITELRT